MQYTPPAGDPAGAPYVDGNRAAGIRGSIVPAAAIEHDMRELVHLIDYAGLTPSADDLTQVRKAIQNMIAAALAAIGGGEGGGDPEPDDTYLLLDQARVRLPIYPEILTADGRMGVTSPANGSVRLPTGVTVQHRGIFPFSTSDLSVDDRTFATAANKTYHLRWRAAEGFVLKDLADAAYNPTAAAETNPAFDSGYDDMLIARVVTSAGNVATITDLANRNRLSLREVIAGTDGKLVGGNGANWRFQKALNWARQPAQASFSWIKAFNSANSPGTDINLFAYGSPRDTFGQVNANAPILPLTRYGLDAVGSYDYASELHMLFSAGA